MATSSADALTDLAAALVVSTRQWQTETSTNAPKTPIEDGIRAVEEQIDRVSDTAKLLPSDRSKLDAMGTELWNVCRVHVMEACPDDEETKTMNSRVLTVAIALLDLASPSNTSGHIRVLEVAFEASRVCIDTAQLDCALKILKVAAKRFDSLESDAPAIDQVQMNSISAEYYMLRVHLAWKQDRPDIADHLFTKVPLKATIKNHSTIVEQCLCIGRLALEAGQYDTSIKLLETALGQLQENLDDMELMENYDFYVRHTLACAYMSIDAPEAAAKLESQMAVLKRRHGENPLVQYLELEIMRLGTDPRSDEFFQTLKAVISRLVYTEEDFNNAIVYIQYSMCLSFGHASEMYQSLLKSLPYDKHEWIEDCFLRFPRVVGNMAAHDLEIPDGSYTTVMKDALAILEARGIESMTQEATDDFFAILLNLLENFDGTFQDVAEKWCQLALDSKIFKDRFISTKLVLQKRLATVCFDNKNLALARQILDQIVAKDDSKCDPEVQYLLFKLALHDEKDIHLKDYVCELSSNSSPFDQFNFLRGCALAAEELNISRLVIDCIQEFMICTASVEKLPVEVLVEQNGHKFKESLSVADSCLFPLSFLFGELEKGQEVAEMDVLDLVNSVLGWVKRGLSSTNAAFSIRELESVGLYSYHLAVHVFNMFPPWGGVEGVLELTKEIFNLSMQRHESIQTTNPQSMPSNSQEEESDPLPFGLVVYLFLYFEVNTRILCVRSHTDVSRKLEHYAKISEAIKEIRDQTSDYSARHPLGTHALRNLSIIEFEAAVALKQWSAITSIVRESEGLFNANDFNRFMGCIVSFEMPDAHRAITIKTMLELIHRAREVPPAISDQLSAYSHFLFTFALAAAKSEDSAWLPDISLKWPDAYHDMAESVIDEFLKYSSDMFDPKPYVDGDVRLGDSSPVVSRPLVSPTEEPELELEYLAKCSFNQAMDFYSVENDHACLRWAEKAILLAKSMRTPEGEELVCLFQKRLEGLF